MGVVPASSFRLSAEMALDRSAVWEQLAMLPPAGWSSGGDRTLYPRSGRSPGGCGRYSAPARRRGGILDATDSRVPIEEIAPPPSASRLYILPPIARHEKIA